MKRFCNYPLMGGGKIAYRNLLTATLSLVLIASSCNSIEDTPANVSRLQVSVTNTTPESRAIVTGNTLPVDAQIGVTLLDLTGQNYDDTPYSNLKYTTANGTDWAISGADAPLLTATDGKAIAYYPWKDGANYTALDVETASQTDYMYSGWVEGINNAAPQANFNMKHGLSAFRVILKKDANYKTEATATTVNIKSDAFVASAKMSAVDGTLSAWTGNGDVTVDMDDITLSTSDQYTDIMVVPAQAAGTEATFTVAVTDANSNSKNYTVDVPFTTAMLQGKCYQFTLTLTATGFEVSTVAVTEWGQVTNAGSGSLAPEVTIPNVSKVYAVRKSDKALIEVDDIDTDNEEYIAVALHVTGKDFEQKFMIAKHNATHDDSNDINKEFLYFSETRNDLSLTNYDNADGTNGSGYLRQPNGTFYATPNLSGDFTTWTDGALSDFNGKANTAVITASSSKFNDMCKVLEAFNAGINFHSNEDFKDWYIPALGQLALIYLNLTEINKALDKIGGTRFYTNFTYWSSSERDANCAWYISINNGSVLGSGIKDSQNSSRKKVRFIRDL